MGNLTDREVWLWYFEPTLKQMKAAKGEGADIVPETDEEIAAAMALIQAMLGGQNGGQQQPE